MGLSVNRRGMSAEVIKIAVAIILGLAVFAMLLNFALGPQNAETGLTRIGDNLLEYENETASKVLNY